MTDLLGGNPLERVHPVVALARRAVETYVQDRRVIRPPDELNKDMRQRAGVFVCLKKNGELRGCVGTFAPTEDNVALEIIRNAVSSAVSDPRFPPVAVDELRLLSYSVDILTRPELVESLSELHPKKYGILVQCGHRRGLLLPDLEGVDTVEDQLAIASRKAGIGKGEDMSISRFEVQRYE
ncbi:MAG: AmmeMemoRadiSam system protein A [Chloroflexi bacterium]|nr:AmmeMemoRadiSam system protein A [Chloroflexota bacterium]